MNVWSMKSQLCIPKKQIIILIFASETGDFETPGNTTENTMMLKNCQITQQTQTQVNDRIYSVCLLSLMLTVLLQIVSE